jgi:ABC-2 type transport system permease protein
MNLALFKKEMRSSLKLLVIFMAILTMYIVLIIGMYDQKTAQALQ